MDNLVIHDQDGMQIYYEGGMVKARTKTGQYQPLYDETENQFDWPTAAYDDDQWDERAGIIALNLWEAWSKANREGLESGWERDLDELFLYGNTNTFDEAYQLTCIPHHIITEMMPKYPPTLYRDRDDRVSEEQATLICDEGKEGLWKGQDIYLEAVWSSVADLEWDTSKKALADYKDELAAWFAVDEDDLKREGVDVEMVRDQLISLGMAVHIEFPDYYNGYLVCKLDLEHHYQGWSIGSDIEYDDEVEEVLELLRINPRKVATYYDLDEADWPNMPERTDDEEVVAAKDLFESWDNTPYGGGYLFLLDPSMLDEIAKIEDMDNIPALVFAPGSRLMIHDYLNGASGLDVRTRKPLDTMGTGRNLVRYFHNDGADNYGVQACCGMTAEAWSSTFEFSSTDKGE